METLKHIPIVIIASVLTGCYIPPEQPKVKVFTQTDTLTVTALRIVHSEAKLFSSAYDKYYVAFSNGDDKQISFGEYSLLNEGDTVIRTKLNTEYFWNYKFDVK